MTMKGFKRKFKPFEILTEYELEKIHMATIQVLRETGVQFQDEKVLRLFAENGCNVDFQNKRVRFPEWLVDDCLSKSPSSFRVRARDSKNDLVLSSGDVTYFSPSCGMKTVDLDTWEPREPTRKEFYDHIKILDALPNVHMQICFPYYGFAKVPPIMCCLESAAAKIRNSSKVQMEGGVADNVKFIFEMVKATNQDVLNLVNPAAPLTYYEDATNAISTYVKGDMPCHFTSGSVAGATGPATLAGVQTTENACNIAGIVLSQLLKPGAKIWAGSMIMIQNMVTGSPAFGAIENSMNEVIFNQIWRRYKVPTYCSACAWTSSKMIDFQAGYEMSLAAIVTALSGASVIYLQGGLTAELAAHPVKAILDDDIAGMIGRFLSGVEVSDETLAVDLINDVGPIPGHFLNRSHTRNWWKKEHFIPKVADRLTIPEWIRLGKKTAIEHARQRMEQILSTHKPLELPPEQEQSVEDILKEARQYYKKKGMITDEEWALYQEDLNSPNYPYA
jgi:trimethylamine---corrinoid protein Co-methyltransferase